MTLVLLLGLTCMVVAAVLLIRALALPRTAQTLEQIPSYGYVVAPEATAGESALRRGLDRLANRFGERMFGRVGERMQQDMRSQLMGAGMYDTTPAKLLGYRIIAVAVLVGVVVWLCLSTTPPLLLSVAMLGIAAYIGWFGPLSVVRSRARARFAAIDRGLPDLIDLLVVTVEGGLSFNASMQMAARHIEGPLGEELRLTLREQSLGLSVQEALRNLLLRCDTAGVRAFVRAVLQGEQLGVSIGQIMRNLAIESRLARKQIAEERAQKAPIKMLFPLIFMIFPAMFVVLLFPSFYSFQQTFHHIHH